MARLAGEMKSGVAARLCARVPVGNRDAATEAAYVNTVRLKLDRGGVWCLGCHWMTLALLARSHGLTTFVFRQLKATINKREIKIGTRQ